MIDIQKHTIGERLKKFRENLNLNQKEFAKTLEVVPNTLSLVEMGTNSLSFEITRKLILKHSINPTWLYIGLGTMILEAENVNTVQHEACFLTGKSCHFRLMEELRKENEELRRR
jgi:transcriptional regulator with XRE-family HTH domain